MDSSSKVPAIVTTSSAPPTNRHSLGAALDAFERRVSRAGLVVETTPPHGVEKDDSSSENVSAKVIRCWNLVDFAIAQAVEHGQATVDNVRCAASSGALVPGNIIALWNLEKGAFLRLNKNKANYNGGVQAKAALPMIWDSERFLVVSGGREGTFALFSPSHKLFLEINRDGCFDASSSQALHVDDRPRASEKFEVEADPKTVPCVRFKNSPDLGRFLIFQVKGLDY